MQPSNSFPRTNLRTNFTIMRLVKTDLRGLNSVGVLSKAGMVLHGMTDNPNFPSPMPTLAQLEDGMQELQVAITNATGGGRLAHALKDTATTKLSNLLKIMGAYVSAVAEGDETMVLGAGFELRHRSTRIGTLERPTGVRASTFSKPGQIALKWKPVRGARVYEVYTLVSGSETEEENWGLIAVSSSSRCMIEGLESCRYHCFRVCGVGAAGKGPFSQLARAIAG